MLFVQLFFESLQKILVYRKNLPFKLLCDPRRSVLELKTILLKHADDVGHCLLEDSALTSDRGSVLQSEVLFLRCLVSHECSELGGGLKLCLWHSGKLAIEQGLA